MRNPDALASLESELHIWIAQPNSVPSSDLIRHFLPLLNQEERDRYQRFHFEHDRIAFLAAHALVRITLSRYSSCEPQEWSFSRGKHGKPEIEQPRKCAPLRFNLSHTKGMVACIVTLDRLCGIDVECVNPKKNLAGIADVVFSDSEIAYLARQHQSDWPENFFKFWTLKESYIKAIGEGLSAPLKTISFDIDSPHIRAAVDHTSLGNAGWLFHHWKPSTTHHMAASVQSRTTPNNFVIHEFDFTESVATTLERSCADFRIRP
jgi:4'-phosphopantetheinyl transferase